MDTISISATDIARTVAGTGMDVAGIIVGSGMGIASVMKIASIISANNLSYGGTLKMETTNSKVDICITPLLRLTVLYLGLHTQRRHTYYSNKKIAFAHRVSGKIIVQKIH